jgi:hypothetical protein
MSPPLRRRVYRPAVPRQRSQVARCGGRTASGVALAVCAVIVVLGGIVTGIPESSAAPLNRPSLNGPVAQRLVLQEINAVRHRFGLSPGSATRAYQSIVAAAAHRNEDPLAAFRFGVVEEFGVWGAATVESPTLLDDVSVIVDDWVYHDGWEGSATRNLDCTSPTAPGCNGHRRAILSHEPEAGARLYIDVGVATARLYGGTGLSIAVLLVWRV